MSENPAVSAWKAQSVDELAARFEHAGCTDDPHGWARSEATENIAQFGRFVFLRSLWTHLLAAQEQCVRAALATTDGEPSEAERTQLEQAFADPLGTLAFNFLYLLGGDATPSGHEARAGEPGWVVMEAFNDGEDLSGRDIGALCESLWECHPDGEQAAIDGGWL